MLLIPWIRRNVHAHPIKKKCNVQLTSFTQCYKSCSFRATEFNETFGQTVASGCETSPTFQWLTPSPSSGCCWRLGKTKTDEQVPSCAVCRPPFGLGARTVGHLFVNFLFYRALNMETEPVPETLNNFHTYLRLSARDFIVNVTHNRWSHLPS